MRGWQRAFFGALIGAILVLAIHPRTSHFYWVAFSRGTPSDVSQMDSVIPWQGKPESTIDYYYAAEIYAERLRLGKLTRPELQSAKRLFSRAATVFPLNAFWDQMLTSVLVRQGKLIEARRQWKQATTKKSWNSGQSQLGDRRAARIQNQLGFQQSWIWARAFFTRSQAPIQEVERTARILLTDASMRDDPGLAVRYDTAVNGFLVKEHCRMIAEGDIATEMIQLSAYPPNMIATPNPKQLYLGQDQVANSLRRYSRGDQADRLVGIYQSAESWTGLVTRRSLGEDHAWDVMRSLMISELGGLASLMLVIGLLIWGIELAVQKRLRQLRSFKAPWVVATGAVTGISLAYVAQYWLGALVLLIVVSLWLWQPQNIRKAAPDDLGPLFNLTVRGLLLAAVSTVFFFFVWRSLPFASVTPFVDGPWDGVEAEVWLRVMILIVSLLLLTVPTWAFAQRLSGPAVMRCLINRSRTTLIWVGAALFVLGGPLAFALNRDMETTFKNYIANEPFYYLR
jgi:hypothetical protein